jgi:hypothetical protein
MRVFFCCVLFVTSALGMASGQDTNFPTGPQHLVSAGSPLFARPISTPTMSLTGPPPEVGASDATGVLTPGAEDQTVVPPQAVSEPATDLFPVHYGEGRVSARSVAFQDASIEPSSPMVLPTNILDTGVEQTTTVQVLQERGYGVSLPQAAAQMKARLRPAGRVYTNADIDRLRGRN